MGIHNLWARTKPRKTRQGCCCRFKRKYLPILCRYQGSAGWPRFSPTACRFLDALLIPGVISKVFETFSYFGPRLISCEHKSPQDFKNEILAAIKVLRTGILMNWPQWLPVQPDYLSVIKAIEHWQCFGGERDEDGHPKYLDDGTVNPDYSP